LPLALLVLLLAAGTIVAWRGCGFYLLGLEDRVDHPDFRILRPSGTVGHGYGFAAAFLVFTNLLYLLRRRGVFQVGNMRTWLDAHVFTGLLAFLFATVHSALQLRTPIATATTVSLGVVVLSGAIGRLLYALVPRSDSARVSAALALLSARIPDVAAPVRSVLESYPGPALAANASLLQSLRALPAYLRAAGNRREALAVVIRNHPAVAAAADPALAQHIDEFLTLSAAELSSAGSAALLRSWRSLHRFFAILMLLTVVVHIAVAWHYGYRWVFS
jgi:hypothetical protein